MTHIAMLRRLAHHRHNEDRRNGEYIVAGSGYVESMVATQKNICLGKLREDAGRITFSAHKAKLRDPLWNNSCMYTRRS